MSDVQQILDEAYKHINAEDFDQAKSLLQPLIDANSNNPDVWWLYSHTTDSAEDGRNALMKVVSLDPNYPGANELIKQYDSSKPPRPTSIDFNDDMDDDDWDDIEKPNNRGRIMRIAIALLIIVGLLVAFILGSGALNSTSPTEQPTAIAQNVPVDPSPLPATDIPTTVPMVDNSEDFELIATNLDGFQQPSSPYTTYQAQIDGDEVEVAQISICANITSFNNQSNAVQEGLQVIAEIADQAPESIAYLAIALVDCNGAGEVSQVVATPRESAIDFSKNVIELRDYTETWRPLNLEG